MKRMLGLLACCMVLFFIGSAVIVFAESHEEDKDEFMSVPMGDIPLEPPESIEAKTSSVVFPHGQHLETSCQECHHTWKKQTMVKTCSAAECHDAAINPQKKQKSKIDEALAIRYYKKAYHDMCIGCHKSILAENLKKELANTILTEPLRNVGPPLCVGCHPEE